MEKQVKLGVGRKEKCWRGESWRRNLLSSQMGSSLQNSYPVVQAQRVVKVQASRIIKKHSKYILLSHTCLSSTRISHSSSGNGYSCFGPQLKRQQLQEVCPASSTLSSLGQEPLHGSGNTFCPLLVREGRDISAPEMGNNSCEGPLSLFSSLSPFACWNLMDSFTTVHCGQGHCL